MNTKNQKTNLITETIILSSFLSFSSCLLPSSLLACFLPSFLPSFLPACLLPSVLASFPSFSFLGTLLT
jgi:hypothetical protein